MHDRYVSPLSERYASRGNAVYFLPGEKVLYLEASLGGSGRG